MDLLLKMQLQFDIARAQSRKVNQGAALQACGVSPPEIINS
jgi:hypothetical protein